jgi:transcriptional regulator with XRE-family HTH domain
MEEALIMLACTIEQGVDWLKQRDAAAVAVAKGQRPMKYRPPWSTAYGARMDDAPPPPEDWAGYLRRMTRRPGWSVARLAREAGVNKSTIFGWIKGDGVTVASVKAIAKALGDDEAHALAAAGGAERADALDADLRIILRRLRSPDASEGERATIRGALRYLADMADRAERGAQNDNRAS